MYRVTIQRCRGSLPQAHIDRQAPQLLLVFNRACSILELARQRTRASAVEVHLVPEQRQPNPTDQEQRSCRSGECYEGNGSFDYIRAHILALLPTPNSRQDRARNCCPEGHCPNGHRGQRGVARQTIEPTNNQNRLGLFHATGFVLVPKFKEPKGHC